MISTLPCFVAWISADHSICCRLDLEAEIGRDLGQQRAVGADELAVLSARHRHVAVDADGELAGLDGLGRLRHGRAGGERRSAPTMSAPPKRRRLCFREYRDIADDGLRMVSSFAWLSLLLSLPVVRKCLAQC